MPFRRAIRKIVPLLALSVSCSAYPSVDEWGLYYYQQDRMVRTITLDFSRFHTTSIGLASWVRGQYPLTVPEESPMFVLYTGGAGAEEVPKTVELMIEHIRLMELPPIGERQSYEGEVAMGITPVEDLQHKIFPYMLGKLLPEDKFLFRIEGKLKHDHYYAIYFDAPYRAGWNIHVKLSTPQLPSEYYEGVPDSAQAGDSDQ